MKPIFGTRQGSLIWLNTEPFGFLCGTVTWWLLVYGMVVTTGYVIVPWLGYSRHGIIHIVLFNVCSLVAIYSHIKVMTTDPGAVPSSAKPLLDDEQENEYQRKLRRELLEEGGVGAASTSMHDASREHEMMMNNLHDGTPHKKYCKRCKAYKPPRAHHCSMCRRCVVKMDHHCPWVNNCVGAGNHKLFLVFLLWVFVTCAYSLLLVLAKYLMTMTFSAEDFHRKHEEHDDVVSSTFLLVFLVMESVLFGLFTLCMMADQLSSISANQTQIDRLKNAKHDRYQQEVDEVCGTAVSVGCSPYWVLPIPMYVADNSLRERIFGYRLATCNAGDELAPLIPDPSASGNVDVEDMNSIELLDGLAKREGIQNEHDSTGISASNLSNSGVQHISVAIGGGISSSSSLNEKKRE